MDVFVLTTGTGSPAEVVEPSAGALIESLRNFGYSLAAAIADLIDNSISAEASDVMVLSSFSSGWIALVDNGHGMRLETLLQAMRLGTLGPSQQRSPQDLGRFGLGLKTASFSQGRRLTVVSKHRDDDLKARCWDLGHVQRTDQWELLDSVSEHTVSAVDQLRRQNTGTAVIIENLDRLPCGDAENGSVDRFNELMAGIAKHLSMVFHRFIEKKKLSVRVNQELLEAWDPFCRTHLKTQILPRERLQCEDGMVSIQPYILPHHSYMSKAEHTEAAGLLGWNAHQGFYIYRGNRLIQSGSWLNLGLRKEEHYKLARIAVDIPNTLDHLWDLNIMKSRASLPDLIRADMRRIATTARSRASDVYRYRGAVVTRSGPRPDDFIWLRTKARGRVRYRINRKHPMIASVLEAMPEYRRQIGHMLDTIEQSIPTATIVSDSSNATDSQPGAFDGWSDEQIADAVNSCYHFLVQSGLPPDDARRRLARIEPFAALGDDLERFLSPR